MPKILAVSRIDFPDEGFLTGKSVRRGEVENDLGEVVFRLKAWDSLAQGNALGEASGEQQPEGLRRGRTRRARSLPIRDLDRPVPNRPQHFGYVERSVRGASIPAQLQVVLGEFLADLRDRGHAEILRFQQFVRGSLTEVAQAAESQAIHALPCPY